MWGKIPILGAVQAGFPSAAEGYEDHPLDLTRLLVRNPAATFFMRAEGNGLSKDGIKDGSILVVDRSVKPSNGKIVVAVMDGRLIVRRLLIPRRGHAKLVPASSQHQIITPTSEHELVIWGVVTAAITRY